MSTIKKLIKNPIIRWAAIIFLSIIGIIGLSAIAIIGSGSTKQELGMNFVPDWLIPDISIEERPIGKLQSVKVDKGSFLDAVTAQVVTTKGVYQVHAMPSFNFTDDLRIEIRGRFANRSAFLCQKKKCYGLIGDYE